MIKKPKNRHISLYSDLNSQEYEEFKKYIALEHLTVKGFLSSVIREFMKECREYYRKIEEELGQH